MTLNEQVLDIMSLCATHFHTDKDFWSKTRERKIAMVRYIAFNLAHRRLEVSIDLVCKVFNQNRKGKWRMAESNVWYAVKRWNTHTKMHKALIVEYRVDIEHLMDKLTQLGYKERIK